MDEIDSVAIMYCKALSLDVAKENCQKTLLHLVIKERMLPGKARSQIMNFVSLFTVYLT
jgi:hypothetical protein